MKILAFSGLGSNAKDFTFLDLPEIEIDVVKRVPPIEDEKLVDYVKRAVIKIGKRQEEEYDAIIGFSFGGLLAQAMSVHWTSTPIILLASYTHKGELVPFSRKRAWGGFAKYAPSFTVPAIISLAGYFYGEKSVSTVEHIFQTTSESFLRWSVQKMARFKPFKSIQQPVYRIMAHNDPFIIAKNCKDTEFVRGGGHFILKTRKQQVEEFILSKIS